MGIYATKSRWQRALIPLVDWCVYLELNPDLFTYGALALSGLAAGALVLAQAYPAGLLLVPVCVLLRLLCNLMDGQVARARAIAGAWGEAKNEFGDRLADAAIFLGLAFGEYTDARLAMLALTLVLCVSYLGILSKALGGPRLYGGLFGKGDRMILLAAFALQAYCTQTLAGFNVYLGAAVLMALVTMLQRLRGIFHYSRATQ
jgi:archaetidylinositol phosphate synthase